MAAVGAASTAASGLNPWLLGLTGIGALGSLFGGQGGMTDEQQQVHDLLLARSKGLDPNLLKLMKARLKAAVGQEHAGLAASTASRLRRQDAPIAIQEQHLGKLQQRRFGAVEDALLGVDRLNEQVKGQALGQLGSFAGGFAQEGPFGQGFGQLFGAGLQGLMGTKQRFSDTDKDLQDMFNRKFEPF